MKNSTLAAAPLAMRALEQATSAGTRAEMEELARERAKEMGLSYQQALGDLVALRFGTMDATEEGRLRLARNLAGNASFSTYRDRVQATFTAGRTLVSTLAGNLKHVLEAGREMEDARAEIALSDLRRVRHTAPVL